MKKEIRLRAQDFIKQEKDLINALREKPESSMAELAMVQFSDKKIEWLCEIGGVSEDLTPEEIQILQAKIDSADQSMTNAANRYAQVDEYIAQAAKNLRTPVPNYDRIVDDKSQIAAIAEDDALKKVRALDKLRKKRDRKNFLNILVRKFKRSKSQEQSQESQGPNNG